MKLGGKKLTHSFYLKPTLETARLLLRKTIVYHHPKGIIAGDIVEVEAYVGEDDPACHASRGLTPGNEVMFGPGGHAYIYFIYGMYYCFNVVTENKGFPAAVLIRGIEPIEGIEIITENSPNSTKKPADGPGKFCRAFGLTKEQNGENLTGNNIYLIDRKLDAPIIKKTPRIGIRKGINRMWRFYDSNSDCVSRR